MIEFKNVGDLFWRSFFPHSSIDHIIYLLKVHQYLVRNFIEFDSRDIHWVRRRYANWLQNCPWNECCRLFGNHLKLRNFIANVAFIDRCRIFNSMCLNPAESSSGLSTSLSSLLRACGRNLTTSKQNALCGRATCNVAFISSNCIDVILQA